MGVVIERSAYQKEVSRKLKTNPVVAILGPRQVGKTTLAQRVTEGQLHGFEIKYGDAPALTKRACKNKYRLVRRSPVISSFLFE